MGSHKSNVHGFPSLHDFAEPAWHTELPHRSFSVQGFRSSQGNVFARKRQPDEGEQRSWVQRLLSSQRMPVPKHEPATQWSLSVQALPSVQGT